MNNDKAESLSRELNLTELDRYVALQETSISEAVRKGRCAKIYLERRTAAMDAIGLRMERTIDMTVKVKPKGKR